MKRSGMIRKVDNLGRIVIPMEIRKLLDIKLQEEMEIFVGENNDVIVRKVKLQFNIENYARRIGEMIYKEVKENTFIVSSDNLLASFGENISNDYMLSDELKQYINKQHYTSFNGGNTISLFNEEEKYFAEIIMPILKDNHPIGAVIIASKNNNFDMSHLRYLRLAVGVLELTINEK